MAVGNAIGDFVNAIVSFIRGIFNSILALVHGVFNVVRSSLKGVFDLFEGVLSFLWHNIAIILVLGLALVFYQIFVVDRRTGAATGRSRTGVAPKKVQ